MEVSPPFPSGNWFGILADSMLKSPKSKRKKPTNSTKEAFPTLPVPSKNNNQNDPKFIVVKSTDVSNPLSKYSVFAKKKALDSISTEYTSVNILRDGSLLVLTKSTKIAEKFIKCKNFGGLCPVSIDFHGALNCCKGTIYDINLANTSEQEILDGLKSQGVVAVYKFTKDRNGIKSPTGRIVLTFNLYKVPSVIDVAWYSLKVEEYFPTPMRCRNCQLLGHTLKRCNNNPTCETCNLPPHNPEKCQRLMCANCFGSHSASDKDCPQYLQQKQILKIKTQNKCDFKEARRLYKIQNPASINHKQTYSSVTIAAPPPSLQPNTLSPNTVFHTSSSKISSDSILSNSNNLSTIDLPTILSSYIASHNSIPSETHVTDLNSNNTQPPSTIPPQPTTDHTQIPKSLSVHSSLSSETNTNSLASTQHKIADTYSRRIPLSLSTHNSYIADHSPPLSLQQTDCVDTASTLSATAELYTNNFDNDQQEPVL
ncbi:uncharacterized protein LOC118754252 [Rhagoletis pomonella]|uniref:uncharacterized protein LOC118754252 n=1 Tax=Rhagoletis pomonella TaxID=28610 RepID=UPI00177E3164|nr:uncharacterized protein LOC118754252 [Rhagoletis pomonella]